MTAETWPRGDGSEVTIGTRVGGKIVTDIIWTVHIANKKANTFTLKEDPENNPGIPEGIAQYEDGHLPSIRIPVSRSLTLRRLLRPKGSRSSTIPSVCGG